MIAGWWDWEVLKMDGRVSVCRQYYRHYSRPRIFKVERYALETIGLDGVE